MSNYQKPKQDAGKASVAELPEEKPERIDYWKHLFLTKEGIHLATYDKFITEDEFNTLRLARIVKVGSLVEVRQIQDRMNAWFLACIESEMEHGVGDNFDERLYAVRMLSDLLEMALVGKVHRTSFYHLTLASYLGCSSEMVMYQKEFFKRGFHEFCFSYSEQGDASSLDDADIKDHTYAYHVIYEFLSHVLASIQDAEVNAMTTSSSPA